ncbi:MAG: ABC transporter permease, partial [Aliihoeflea sp.]
MYEFLTVPQIITGILWQLAPVWAALAVVLSLSFFFRRSLGLYGELFGTGVGIAGLTLCYFWLFTALFASIIAPFNPLAQVLIMKDALPGAIDPDSGRAFLLGGDRLARDIFSRTV